MIGMLHGQVDFIDAASAIIEVGGVGYETRMPSADLASMHAGQTVKVYTSLNVSQDAITLYGFSSLASKRMFLQLQKVSGIGPKSRFPCFRRCSGTFGESCGGRGCHRAGEGAWSRQEGAQKIILELKGSIDLSQIEGASKEVRSAEDAGSEQVVEGLMSLGWRQQDALHAVQTVCESIISMFH